MQKNVIWLILLLLANPVFSRSILKLYKQKEKSYKQFAKRIKRKNCKLAYRILKRTFGSSRNNILILCKKGETAPLTGVVLKPTKIRKLYRKYYLPVSKAMHGHITVEKVFFLDINRDGKKEILILCSQMTGIGPTGAKPWYETYVYQWYKARFRLLEKIRKKVFNISSVARIRRKLLSGQRYKFKRRRIVRRIKRLYLWVQKKLKRSRRIKKKLMGYSTEGGVLKAYRFRGRIIKITAQFFGETGKTREDYFFYRNRLFFIYKRVYRYNRPFGKVVHIQKSRFYFFKNRLIQWINKKGKKVSPANPLFSNLELKTLKDARLFIKKVK